MSRYLYLTLLSSAIIFAIFYFVFFQRENGNQFAKKLIERSLAQNGEMFVGDPSNIESRICFAPELFGIEELKRHFPNVPVAYMETDDSNLWYVVKYSKKESGLIILGVEHSLLRWNNYNGVENKDIFELNFDEDAEPVCVSKVKIYFWGKDRIPTFRPVYTSRWR